ncbi:MULTISPECIES: hypothetical protein [unclassified Undibacterium]|uniref:hypothetical protein n=1 Tax=unclassified Undibacterium TaxID=2630295 RepID=UPI002AC97E50|nr:MULTISPECIES: hypothetical protein [unclassified Undibacterium]MEB0138290.1 hypothetical protein [Undibacterium sp. CCC2.1]MEB0170776.1 hypothetical protein [Undibacterium sp. CCC1.1]MEB0174665.1 hypothetical protein [Undibacterium sp. CCC3.4]MEB0213862.1 hypothetical protein [Undibacterium sp. 5I2]WPX42588.1 hypothetical protein RHM61_14485 [Undibacterium sp. CCC3.4]
MITKRTLFACLLLCATAAQAQLQSWGSYPPLPGLSAGSTPSAEAPLAMLEQRQAPAVSNWLGQQDVLSRAVLARLAARTALAARLQALAQAVAQPALMLEWPESIVYALSGNDGRSRVLLRQQNTGAERVLYIAAPEQQILALVLAPERDKLIVVARSQTVGKQAYLVALSDANADVDVISGLPPTSVAAQDVCWSSDGKSVFYRSWRSGKMELRRHVLGQAPVSDRSLLEGSEKMLQLAAADTLTLSQTPASNFALLTQQSAAGRSYFLSQQAGLQAAKASWQQVATPADQVVAATESAGMLYFVTAKGRSPTRIEQLDLRMPQLQLRKASIFLKNSQFPIEALVVNKDALFWHTIEAGVSHLYRAPLKGASKDASEEVSLPIAGKLSELALAADGVSLQFRLEGGNVPALTYRLTADRQLLSQQLPGQVAGVFPGLESKSIELPAADGAKLLLTLYAAPELQLDGSHPLLLMPVPVGIDFDPTRLAWIERQGVVALLAERVPAQPSQRSADIIAAANYLIRAGYTVPARLLGQETRPGQTGLITAVLQRPELFAAVSLADPELAQSGGKAKTTWPYQALRGGLGYPAILFTLAEPVSPATLKLVAGLQILSTSRQKPVLLSTKASAADNWAFLLWQAGDKTMGLMP